MDGTGSCRRKRDHERIRGRALFVVEFMRFRMGAHDSLLRALSEIVAIFEAEGNRGGTADVLMMAAGLASLRAGDIDQAREYLERSNSRFEALADERRIAITLVFLGVIPLTRATTVGRRTTSSAALRWPVPRVATLEYLPAAHHLALAAQGKEEYGKAARYYTEVLTLVESIGDKAGVALAMVGLAECAAGKDEPERAGAPLWRLRWGVRQCGHVLDLFNTSPAFHEHFADLIRVRLGDEAMTALRAEGQAMTFDQAVEYALELD